MNHYRVERMQPSQVQMTIDWANQEGWNPGVLDAACFYQADLKGFFVGLLNDHPIAVGSAVVYDDHFAFCGLYIVKKEFRGQGYGIQLTEERLKYTGDRITGIDGILANVDKYKRLGYVEAYKNTRYIFTANPSAARNAPIVDLQSVPFADLEVFDRHYFPAPRSRFLKNWVVQPGSKALGFVEKGQLRGYGVIRKCIEGYKIGPLFAETVLIAQLLLAQLSSHAANGPVFIDIPEPNQEAQALTRQFNMTPNFIVMRMYRNGFPNMDLKGIYGMTSFEIG